MDIAENYALGFAYYKYKTLISFKIYVVYISISQLNSIIINYDSSESVIAKRSTFSKNVSDGQFLILLITHDD